LLAQSSGEFLYGAASNVTAMAPTAIGNTGGSQAHNNLMPFLTLSFCIALQGIFPSQT
jgi:microcystin-dependent protein